MAEIWLPQVGPTKLGLIWETRSPASLARASWIFVPSAKVSCLVWTCHCGGLPGGWVTVAVALAPGSTLVTAASIWVAVTLDEGNVKTEPPLKSTL